MHRRERHFRKPTFVNLDLFSRFFFLSHFSLFTPALEPASQPTNQPSNEPLLPFEVSINKLRDTNRKLLASLRDENFWGGGKKSKLENNDTTF